MKYTFGKYKYLDELVKLNSFIIEELYLGENIRIKNPDELEILNTLLKTFFEHFNREQDYDEKLKLLLNLAGSFYCLQPFYDGNARTTKTFIILILSTLDMKINIDMKNHSNYDVIPLFYSAEEQCTGLHLKKLKELITHL